MCIERAVTRRRIENFEVARDRIRAVARLDGARIGGVDPGETALAVARPDRSGKRFEQLRDRVDVAAQLLMTGGKRGELALRFGQVLDAQHRPPADRAAFGEHVTLLQGGERERKALALSAQRVDGVVHPERLFRAEPAPERKHAARQRRPQQDRYVPRDVGRVGAGGPDHDHLRFGEQQRTGTVALLAQLIDLGLARRQARARCVRACATA